MSAVSSALRRALAERLERIAGRWPTKLFGERTELAMDEASRMARAHEQGFTREAYRGLNKPHRDDLALKFSNEHPQWFAASPETAESYLVGGQSGVPYIEGANILPARLRMQHPVEIDAGGANWLRLPISAFEDDALRTALSLDGSETYASTSRASRLAREHGYDGMIIRNVRDDYHGKGPPREVYAVFAPTNVRSRFARFDPARSSSADLLAGLAVGVPVTGLTLREALLQRAQENA